ncbi:omega-hydroxypalmitate O-feruloyl transferase [Prunus yedoensis var. nudiflora]|uniref:Omega-hydroxypalmitate O-feruloyl transferase n=1 Tax=Prunus yedoensis var. nudiflora TaxID=2094558 RepID=A0A314XP37_PRUYE|nr:omega-hydroxypalmitate O-feruloyl transferase [Prunus yedoensis var. nudiflora]
MAPPWVQELHFPHLPSHYIDHMVPVMPSGPTPTAPGQSLYLSTSMMWLEPVFSLPQYIFMPQITGDRLKTLRDALASVLVPYYPLSGRLRETNNGKLEVFFGQDQGALMVEAHSEMSLSDLGDLKVPNPAWSPLIFRFPNEEPTNCGGFSLGLRICHCIVDGLGAMQFLSSWAATAKAGTLITNPKPCWDRDFFRPRDPPLVKFPHIEFMRIEDGSSLTMSLWQTKAVQKCYRISREFQAWLKTLAQPEDDMSNVTCSTFDAMAAHIWRSWVKALDVKPLNYELRLTFSVNARQKPKNPPLKEGFYGNVVCLACVKSTVRKLVYGRFPDTARLVREARLGISEEYLRSTVDYVEVDRPRRLEFGGKLTITQWTRFSIYDSADFGWGRPMYAGPIDLTPTPQVCVFSPEARLILVGQCLCVFACRNLLQKASRTFCLLQRPVNKVQLNEATTLL